MIARKTTIKDNNGRGTTIEIPPGFNHFKIIEVIAPEIYSHHTDNLGVLWYWIGDQKGDLEIIMDESICVNRDNFLYYALNIAFAVEDAKCYRFRLMKKNPDFNGEITLHYELSEIEKIDVAKPELDFQEHLENYDNAKIVFSAPFGDGKTTFLDYFFEKRKEKYEVFKVFPVNYSVASNEDIFKYIKADILFQLLAKGVEFDKEEFSKKLALESYVFFNPRKTVFSFLQKFSSLDKKTELLSKVILGLRDILANADNFREEIETNDQKNAVAYIQSICEEEGSLFEDNFYTQLIRQLLARVRENSKKETVLIIEDLDRMDPDHVFRILNVISAHYDTYKYAENEASHNKFGFDKIMVVCDVKNIRSIFEHRHGPNVHFEGYFNKFFSTKPFEYDNKMMIREFAIEYLNMLNSEMSKISHYVQALVFLVEILIEKDLISLREFIKLQNFPYFDFQDRILNNSYDSNDLYFFHSNIYSLPIHYLHEHFNKNLLVKFDNLKKQDLPSDPRYHKFSKDMIAGLSYVNSALTHFQFNDIVYQVKRKDENNYVIASSVKFNNEEATFTKDDFFDLLILTTKQFLRLEKK